MKSINKIYYRFLLLIVLFNFTIFSVKDAQELAIKINEIVEKYPAMTTGIEIYSLKQDKLLYSLNSNKLLTPASNAKLFTSICALNTFGKDYQFTTQIISDNEIIENVLIGNIYLKPDADPSFNSKSLENLIKKLHELGLKEIKGDFLIINKEFDQEGFAPGTTIDDLGDSYFNPVGSLIIDHKAAVVAPVNTVNFTDNKKLENIFFDLNSVLRFLFNKYDIKFSSVINFTQEIPAKSYLLAEHKSEKLSAIIAFLLKESDNLYADCLFKKLAFHKYKEAATWQKSRECLNEFLKEKLNIEPLDIKIVDGAGLSRYTLVSPHQIITLLKWAYVQPNFKDFLDCLPVAGIDGTLKERMLDTKSKVKAKTGTCGGVSSLSGYIETEDDLIAFSIINNGYLSQSLYNPPCKTEIEDAICKLLAE